MTSSQDSELDDCDRVVLIEVIKVKQLKTSAIHFYHD